MAEFSRLLETVEASLFVKFNELKKRNVRIGTTRTSVTLEPQVWDILHEVAEEQGCTVHELCTFISERKDKKSSLTSAIRVFLLSYLHVRSKKGK